MFGTVATFLETISAYWGPHAVVLADNTTTEHVMSNLSACRAALLAAPLLGLIAFPARADAPTVIKVDLDNTGTMQMLKLEPATVTAGKVHFQVSNASVDSEHEMIVVKTALTPDKFPTNADHSR